MEATVALIGLVTAFVGLFAALVVLFVKLREVHHLVNSHAERQEARIAQLLAALTASGIVVPPQPDRRE